MSVKAIAAKSEGQQLLERIETFLCSYLVFPNEHIPLVCALWALNTYVFKVCDATPYLAITALTKRAGKTTLLDLLSFLSRNPERIGAGTIAATFRLMEQHDGWCALFGDEMEKMSGTTASLMRQFWNFGYRRGETIPRTMPGGPGGKGYVVKFPCYGPKAFALIGDPEDTLRDRCILVVMKRAISQRPYRPTVAQGEATGIVTMIERYLRSGALADMRPIAPEWLTNRDQEIWEPLWSLAVALGCDHATLERLQRASAILVEGKAVDLRKFRELAEAETVAAAGEMSEKCLRDAQTILKSDPVLSTARVVFSAELVARLRAIPTAPWQAFRGLGLTELNLADLFNGFGLHPDTQARGRKVRGRGYKTADILNIKL